MARAELAKIGKIRNIHYGDVLINYPEVLNISTATVPFIAESRVNSISKDSYLENGDIVIADTAEDESVGKTTEIQGITDHKIVSGLHTIPCRPLVNFSPNFLGFLLNSPSYHDQLKPLIQGIKVSSISKKALGETRVCFAKDLDEQAQIGGFFNGLEMLITLHQRKLETLKKLKRTLLQKMFPKKGQLKPELRFPGFTNDWEQRKLVDLVDRVTRKNQDLVSELPLTISAQYGLIDQNEFFDKRVASKDVSGYYLIENGEFAYNKSTSTDAPWGAVKRLDHYENGVLSTLYIVFGIKENNPIDSNFLVSYYNTNLWHKGIREIAAEGARNHGLLNIVPADFFETELMIPQDIEEQKQIGKFFKELEALITLHQRMQKNSKQYIITMKCILNNIKY